MKFKKFSSAEILKKKPGVLEMRLRNRNPIYAIFDNIRSLYNIGAMFRTSDAALVDKVFLTGITGKPPRREIDKSALGATDVVPWEYCPDSLSVIKMLKSIDRARFGPVTPLCGDSLPHCAFAPPCGARGVSIVALELTRKSLPYFKMEYSYPACLVVGNEVDGVSQEVLDKCDFAIQIPMLGRANSLNVSTAYGIAIFEMLKQYKYA